MSIAVVVPTIRVEAVNQFILEWNELLFRHDADLVVVYDGENPTIEIDGEEWDAGRVMDKDSDLIYNFNDGVRNLGFAFISKHMKDVDAIITLDDDVSPSGDTMQDHLNVLNMKVPISWMSTASEYTRGFPYEVREEVEVVLSHGVWEGVADWDAKTQLEFGNRLVTFYKGPIPRGVYFPMCGMNLAFKRKMLPYMYFAPMGPKVGIHRFADIWCGINAKKWIDFKGWAAYSGGSSVIHSRMSDPNDNLKKEQEGMLLNELYWKGKCRSEYFRTYQDKMLRWQKWILSNIS